MTLFEAATELRIRLRSASEADAQDELMSRGRTVRGDIVSAAEHLEAVQSYRVTIGRTDAPMLDTRAIRQAIGRFRGALSRSGPKALQQQSAATLRDVLTTQSKRVDRWVKSTWRENFAATEELLARVASGELPGSVSARAKAQNRASRIEYVLSLNPVEDRQTLETYLNAEGLNACIARVNQLIEELRDAIVAMDLEQTAMPPEVRAAIQRATSDDGLPLSEVTPELMTALRSAGVLDDLVVRRL